MKVLLPLILALSMCAVAEPKREPHDNIRKSVCEFDHRVDCRKAVAVPEGGSTLGYLGITVAVLGIVAYETKRKKMMIDHER